MVKMLRRQRPLQQLEVSSVPSQQPQVVKEDYLEVVHLRQLIQSQRRRSQSHQQEVCLVVEMQRRQRLLQQLEVSLVAAAQQVVEEGYLGAVHLRQLIQSQRRRSQSHQQEVCLVVEMPRRQRPLLQLEVSLVVVAQLPL